jgi:hypothetical protein
LSVAAAGFASAVGTPRLTPINPGAQRDIPRISTAKPDRSFKSLPYTTSCVRPSSISENCVRWYSSGYFSFARRGLLLRKHGAASQDSADSNNRAVAGGDEPGNHVTCWTAAYSPDHRRPRSPA